MLFSTEQTIPSGTLSGHCARPETEKDKHQLSDHSLAIETGGQTWQPGENRLCQSCQQQEREKEQHFLLLQPVWRQRDPKLFTKIKTKIQYLL